MSIDDNIMNEDLRIGDMPRPQYLIEAPNTTGPGNIKWIGIRAYSLEQQIEDFLWWRNIDLGDLNNETIRFQVAHEITRCHADIAVGPAIDFHGSDPATNQVATLDTEGVFGLYVEAKKRPLFNLSFNLRGVELARGSSAAGLERTRKMMAVMPYPFKPSSEPYIQVRLKNDTPVRIHRAESDSIVINYPGISGEIDGYNNKYGQLADLIVESGIGAVVRTENKNTRDYPNGMIDDFRQLIDYTLTYSIQISGYRHPKLYLMGFSAGASTIAAVANEYSAVKKILLMAPSGDAGQELIETGLGRFEGEVYIAIGANDQVVGSDAGKTFYDLAQSAAVRKLEIIPNCDHQFRGEVNGRILSKAPAWAFAGDTSFPSPEGGTKLYD